MNMKKLIVLFFALMVCLFTTHANLPCNTPDCNGDCCNDQGDGSSNGGGTGGSGGGGSGGAGGGKAARAMPMPASKFPRGGAGEGAGSAGAGGGGAAGNSDDSQQCCQEEKCCDNGEPSNSSVSVPIAFGRAANERVDLISQFSIYTETPSPLVYTPQLLQYRNYLLNPIALIIVNQRYADNLGLSEENQATDSEVQGKINISSQLSSNIVLQLKIFTARREQLVFEFENNQSIANLVGDFVYKNYKMVMVDAAGTPVTTQPVYFDLHLGRGKKIRYQASNGAVHSYTTETGRILKASDPSVGLEAIYNDGTIVRQVKSTADGLADIVTLDYGTSYEIRLYAPDKVGSKVSGLYTVNGEPHTVWKIENPLPGQNTRVKVTKTVGDVSNVYQYEYSQNAGGWTLKYPDDLLVESISSTWNNQHTVRSVVAVKKTPQGVVASKVNRTFQVFSYGERLMSETRDPDGAHLVTSYTYDNQGRQVSVSKPDGNWEVRNYNANGWISSIVTPFLNSEYRCAANQAKEVVYDYTPHDSRDVVGPDDQRPRTITEKILGIVTKKTFYAYYFDNNEFVEIEERCAAQDAVYGAAGNLRTEWRYYPKGEATSASAGRLKTVKHPNGTMDTYTYDYGALSSNADPLANTFSAGSGNAVRVTVTSGTVESPSGIAGKTIRNTFVYGPRGNLDLEENYVYTGETYQRFSWMAYLYDEQNRQIEEYASNGTRASYTWNCCAKESETLADGTQYTYVYDATRRLVSKTKVGGPTETYEYNAAGHRVKTTVTGGDLSMVSTKEYNLAGQVTKHTDFQGLVTTYQYVNGINTGSQRHGLKQLVTQPGGFTTIIDTTCDGNISSITGTAQVSSYYTYGIEENGSQWLKINMGGGNSARWQKNTDDLLGREVLQECSGYNGTVMQQNFYNNQGMLTRREQTGTAPMLYEYDSLGNIVREGLDVDNSNTLELAGNDRITDYDISLNNTWKTVTTKTYGTNGSADATVISIQKERLSGFTNSVIAEKQITDIHGNVTTTTRSIDRSAKTVTTTTEYPDSIISAQIITVNRLKNSERTKTGLTTTYAYDGLGRVITVNEPRIGATSITYHTAAGKNGLKATVTNAAGNMTSYDYDTTNGRLLWEKNALNQYTRYAYNALGQVTNIWGDTQYPVEFGYDQFGQKTTMRTFRPNAAWNGTVWPAGVTGDLTTWTFDEASGVVTAKTDAANQSVTYTYTTDGKLTKRTWARGVFTNYLYDTATGELLKVDYADDTPDITYTYNRLGKLATIQDAVGTRNFVYDGTFDLIKETINGIYSRELKRTYTDTGMKGRPLSLYIGNILNYSYGYDEYGRLNKITTPMGDFNYTRLENSDLVVQMTRPNTVTTTWSYESHRNLITQINNGGISIFDYINNATANRISTTHRGNAFSIPNTITYTYDNRNEIIGANYSINNHKDLYSYDSIGNRISITQAEKSFNYISNILNQYTVINAEEPTYDTDGNMLTWNSWHMTWNADNRLKEICNDSIKVIFIYDYLGRRIKKTTFSHDNGNWMLNKIQHFVYDNFKQIEELDAMNNNMTARRYSWQPPSVGLDVLLSITSTVDGKNYALNLDGSKNIEGITDENGAAVIHYEYSPFGCLISDNKTDSIINPFRFSCEYYDTETELIYYNYRYYNPNLGRWLSRDPIGIEGGLNPYTICTNNTISFYDQLGLLSVIPTNDVKNAGRNSGRNLPSTGGFIVKPTNSKCNCPGDKPRCPTGKVFIVQYKRPSGSRRPWEIDAAPQRRWTDGKNTHVYAYTDPSPQAPQGGAPINAGHPEDGYIDAPGTDGYNRTRPLRRGYSMDFRIESFCRCKGEDDKYLNDSREFHVEREPNDHELKINNNHATPNTPSVYPERATAGSQL